MRRPREVSIELSEYFARNQMFESSYNIIDKLN